MPRGARPSRTPLSAAVIAASLLFGLSFVTQAAPNLRALEDSGAVQPAGTLGLAKIVGGLNQPVFVTNAGDSRLFVVEQTGRIRILKLIDGTWRRKGTFLDLRGKVTNGYEQGLLGLAFAPDYASSGRFYVDYTNTAGDTIVAEYRRATSARADPNSARRVLKVNQPFSNHNGGWIGFRPGDGQNLYIGLGDGGDADDPYGNGQSKNTLLGKILRIDPRDPDGSGPMHYSIPSDNPFVGVAGRDEIYAYGLRNPWRSSFDTQTGDLYIGDVGQNRYEEVNHVARGNGKNFGWDKLEGRHLNASGDLCTSNCKTLPIIEYPHDVSGEGNCSVIGGYVSRRPGASLFGEYVFGDNCSGRIWHVPADFNGTDLPAPLNSTLQLSSFGIGSDLTIYAVSLGGSIYRVSGS
jgi:glucose/arabinose dehydrogenase